MKNLILLFLFFLMGSQVVISQSQTNDLPVIDLSRNYPKKEICIQDMADIEYVPLETTDDVLLGNRLVLSYVSDKYILIHEPIRGNIFVFNRNGKIYSQFNHKGQSGREYAWIGDAGTILDEKNEEIYVCNQYIQVYSLRGEYKRTLKVNTILNYSKVFNFNDEALLVYDDVVIDRGFEDKTKKNPYRLVSKKDGSLIAVLGIHLPERYSTRMLQIDKNSEREIFMYYHESMHYGQDVMIADISSDTLYHLSPANGLTPILTRKPSVHASEPRNVWVTFLTTDKFILMGTILLDFNTGGKIPFFMYEFDTGKISKAFFLDAEYGNKNWNPGTSPAIGKNKTAHLIQASSVIDAYNRKRLAGNGMKIAKTLLEDDNPVVRIIKFK